MIYLENLKTDWGHDLVPTLPYKNELLRSVVEGYAEADISLLRILC